MLTYDKTLSPADQYKSARLITSRHFRRTGVAAAPNYRRETPTAAAAASAAAIWS